MTNEEAIKTLEIAIAEVEWNYPMEYSVAFEKAIDSIKMVNKLEKSNRNWRRKAQRLRKALRQKETK